MKILINTSNLYFGGGVQVALSFINELQSLYFDHQYYIVLSPVVEKQIEQNAFPENFHFYLIEKSSSSLKSRSKSVNKLKDLEKQINPDVVFSVFGPSYWRPQAKHLMGFALPWIINPESNVYSTMSTLKRWKEKIGNTYRSYYITRDGDYYVVETDDIKNRLNNILGITSKRINVIGNTYSSVFNQKIYDLFQISMKYNSVFRMVTISHNYPHKNLQIITEVIPYLKSKNIKFEFIVTIDENSYNELFSNYKDNVINIGKVDAKYCPSIYQQCDALFLPTLLECFSASYPEAMKMERPILTSNYSFAKDICKDAALYFDPLNPKEIAEKIIELSSNKKLQKTLIENGNKVLSTFETANSRAKKYIQLCEQISKK